MQIPLPPTIYSNNVFTSITTDRVTGLADAISLEDATNLETVQNLISVPSETITTSGSTLSTTGISVVSPTAPNIIPLTDALGGSLPGGGISISSVVDNLGNLYNLNSYTAGITLYNRDITSTLIVLPTVSVNSVLLTKVKSNGDIDLWCPIPSSIGSTLSIDSYNNLFVAGRYNSNSTVNVYNFSNNSTVGTVSLSLPSTSGAYWYFVIKYSSGGTAISFTVLEGNTVSIDSITIDSDNNLFIAGLYNGGGSSVPVYNFSTTLSTTPFSLASTSSNTGYIIKFDSSGVALGYTATGSNSYISPITIDKTSNVLYSLVNLNTGSSTSIYNISSNPIVTPFSVPGDTTYAIIKFNSTGTALGWSPLPSGIFTGISTFKIDSIGTFYMLLPAHGSVTEFPIYNFSATDSEGFSPFTYTSAGSDDLAAIIKWNSSGTATGWTSFTGIHTRIADLGSNITIDSKNNVYVIVSAINTTGGASSYTIDLVNMTSSSTPGTIAFSIDLGNTGSNQHNTIIYKMNSSGVIQSWTKMTGSYIVTSIVSDNNDCVTTSTYYSGVSDVTLYNFSTTSTIGSIRTTMNADGSSNNRGILAKYLPDGTLDLGNIMAPFTINLPDATSIMTKELLLTTTNYQYTFVTSNGNIVVNGTFENNGLDLKFLWNGSKWILLK